MVEVVSPLDERLEIRGFGKLFLLKHETCLMEVQHD